MGQPQLKAKLENARLEQFKQRIAVYFHLYSLTRAETESYIRHRLKLVSSEETANSIFTEDAITHIYNSAKGTPRLINLTCDSALLSAYVLDTKLIDEKIITDVITERSFDRFAEDKIEETVKET